jgi:hypothetical protein
MIKLFQFLWSGCWHKWTIIDKRFVWAGCSDKYPIDAKYILQCEKCDEVKYKKCY